MKYTMFLALAAAVFLSSAYAQLQPSMAAAECAEPGKTWQPLFQFPESPAQAEQLWKVDFQELVFKGRLSADQASFLLAQSPKAKESQGKLAAGYVIAFNPCGNQLLVDYREATPLAIDPNEVVNAALRMAAPDSTQTQGVVAPTPQAAQGPNVGSQIGQTVAGAIGTVNPLALLAVPVAGFVGSGIGKIVGSGSNKPQPTFSLNRKNWWKDF